MITTFNRDPAVIASRRREISCDEVGRILNSERVGAPRCPKRDYLDRMEVSWGESLRVNEVPVSWVELQLLLEELPSANDRRIAFIKRYRGMFKEAPSIRHAKKWTEYILGIGINRDVVHFYEERT